MVGVAFLVTGQALCVIPDWYVSFLTGMCEVVCVFSCPVWPSLASVQRNE